MNRLTLERAVVRLHDPVDAQARLAERRDPFARACGLFDRGGQGLPHSALSTATLVSLSRKTSFTKKSSK